MCELRVRGTGPAIYTLSQLQQHEPFLVVERALLGRRPRARRLRQRLRQGPLRRAAAVAFLRGRESPVAAQVELARGDRLIDVAADRINFARALIDVGDHLAMAAPDRARLRAAVEIGADALAHRLVIGVGERRLALAADHVADARPRRERAGAVDVLIGFAGDFGRSGRERIVDVGAVGIGELEGVGAGARLANPVADEGRRPRGVDDGGAERGLAQDLAFLRVAHVLRDAQQACSTGAQEFGVVAILGRGRGVAIAAYLELVGRGLLEQRPPVFHHVPPAEMAEARLPVAAVVLVVLRLGEAEAEDAAVGIDAVAAEAGELVDRRLRDAASERAGGLGGGGVAGRLNGFPEGRRALALSEGRRRERERRHKGADSNAHGPFPNWRARPGRTNRP